MQPAKTYLCLQSVFFLKTDTSISMNSEYYYSISNIDLFKLKKELCGGQLEGIGFDKNSKYLVTNRTKFA